MVVAAAGTGLNGLPKTAERPYILCVMSAMPTALSFASAYRQLQPVEKAYVDGYVRDIEAQFARRGERISNALYYAIPADVVEASRGMLDRPLVRAAITERINELAAASELTGARVIKELMAMAFSNVEHYMPLGADGLPSFDMTRCTPEQLSAIQSFEIEENMRGGRKIKFKLHPKLDALDKLMRYMGLLDADNSQWRSEQAKPIGAGTSNALSAAVSENTAAEAYARFLNG